MPIDVVVWGATGYTGKLVAEYLSRRYGVGKSLAWGIAGRSRTKLESVRASLEAIDPAARELPIFVGDGGDRASLEPIARATRVVASTVGPFVLHGRELVAACVEAGTSYCDITGEPTFMRAMIDAHHARARETGARIVHACGYDSIPADLGALMVQTHAREAHGTRCSAVKYFAGDLRGGLSGGTAASVAQIAEDASRDVAVRRLLADPYALDPDYDGTLRDVPDLVGDQRGVAWDDDIQAWTGPYPFAMTDTRVVRRTNALLDYAWGKDFVFRQSMSFAAGPGGWALAAGATAAIALGFAAMSVTPVRRALARDVFPRAGDGPSPETRDSGFFVSRLVGLLDSGGKVYGVVRGKGDPGYGETSKMLSEAAVSLAKDTGGTRSEGGVLTAGACLGMRLVERLREAGIVFEVGDSLEALES